MISSKVSRRQFLKSVGVVAGGWVLAACTTAPGAVPGPSSEQPAAEMTTLLHWHALTASDGEVWEQLLDNHNEAHENVQIEYELITGGQIGTKIGAAIAVGEPPDFSIWGPPQAATWHRDGVIVPLDDIMQTVGLDLDDFVASPLEANTIQGELLGIPMDVMTLAAEINAGHAKEAGLDVSQPPLDGESLLAWSDAMTQRDGDDVTRSGFLLTGSAVQPNVVFRIIAHQYGAERLDDDWTKVTFLDTDAPVKAAQWVLDAFDEHKISSRDIADRYKAFGGGVGSIFWTGPWILSGYMETEGLEFMTAKVSTVGDKFTTAGFVSSLILLKNPNPDRHLITAETMKWLSDNSFLWVTEGRGAAPRRSMLEDPAYKTEGHPWEIRAPFTESIEDAFPGRLGMPDGNDFGYYAGGDDVVPRSMDPVWAGERSIEEGLETLVQLWEETLERNRA